MSVVWSLRPKGGVQHDVVLVVNDHLLRCPHVVKRALQIPYTFNNLFITFMIFVHGGSWAAQRALGTASP